MQYRIHEVEKIKNQDRFSTSDNRFSPFKIMRLLSLLALECVLKKEIETELCSAELLTIWSFNRKKPEFPNEKQER